MDLDLRIVYRTLRQISDWVLTGYFSEVHVEGWGNVPRDGPVIIACTHHNEIIDIATLAATIPHRRHVSFWAKSTAFKHPVTRWILESSGAIPVKRNPNASTTSSSSTASSTSHPSSTTNANRSTDTSVSSADSITDPTQNLFLSTSKALAANKVIGVFPEGTSYTQPRIVQVMSGAAWAGVEYARYQTRNEEGNGKDVVIVPVGIVYTDKSRYQSRVRVGYGTPIHLSDYKSELFSSAVQDSDERARSVVKKIMAEVETQLFDMTVNAPDWETLYAARTARDILWPGEIGLNDWLEVNQRLVTLFTPSSSPSSDDLNRESLERVRSSLTQYFSLLHHTQLSHTTLASLLPSSSPLSPSSTSSTPSSASLTSSRLVLRLLTPTPKTILLSPLYFLQTLLFIPPFLTHIPAYILSRLSRKYLAPKDEEESQSEFKAVLGGVGVGVGVASTWLGMRNLAYLFDLGWIDYKGVVKEVIDRVPREVFQSRSVLGNAARMLLFGWVMVKWHGILIKSNYRRYRTLLERLTLLSGLLSRKSSLSKEELEPYTRPPPPPTNAFIKRRAAATASSEPNATVLATPPKKMPTRRLIWHLLQHKEDATRELKTFLSGMEGEGQVTWLKEFDSRR